MPSIQRFRSQSPEYVFAITCENRDSAHGRTWISPATGVDKKAENFYQRESSSRGRETSSIFHTSPASETKYAVLPMNWRDAGRSRWSATTVKPPSSLTLTSEPVLGSAESVGV